MVRYSRKRKVSDETHDEAQKITKGTQVPGQTKEQSKIIAQGIERGIELYKKQNKEKARDLDRRRRQLDGAGQPEESPHSTDDAVTVEDPKPSSARLPWTLLLLTWIAVIISFDGFFQELRMKFITSAIF